MLQWLLLILSLPTENATVRMRVWRALKAAGAAVLRDGVYLLPDRAPCRVTLERVAAQVQAAGGGRAWLLRAEADAAEDLRGLFDRGADYAALLDGIGAAQAALPAGGAAAGLRQARRLRKAFAGLGEIDFFPGEARRQVEAALQALEAAVRRAQAPDEPQAHAGTVPACVAADYRGRVWATRRRPWVDRLASAWLIRRCIDPDARFLWLAAPADCPPQAVGFDFDGAAFSHVGARVTFETLLASFGLDRPALARIAALVHYLDVGGVPPAEASGVERVLLGLRETVDDDDRLLQAACGVFDALLAAFEKEPR